ncbi:MAG TPA: hypothetical protein VG389_20135 [Myxococcota bacterium]|nr:hypothetical protein [Myxococcota bacterium]
MKTSTRTTWLGACVALLLTACGHSTTPPVGEDPAAVLAARTGTYDGSWELFGRAADGTVYSATTWTDVAVADRPTFEAERAYLHVVDNLFFAGGMQITQEWLEGVLLEADGSAGQTFIEMDGADVLVDEIEPDHFHYETEVTPADLYFVEGVTPDVLVAGYHVVDKVVTFPGGTETHTVTRMTHLEWNDATGTLQTADFQSLAGVHVKVE